MISEHDFKFKQIVFLFASNGEKLSFSNDNIVVKDANGVFVN
jgi:CRISPR-associated protein Cas1